MLCFWKEIPECLEITEAHAAIDAQRTHDAEPNAFVDQAVARIRIGVADESRNSAQA